MTLGFCEVTLLIRLVTTLPSFLTVAVICSVSLSKAFAGGTWLWVTTDCNPRATVNSVTRTFMLAWSGSLPSSSGVAISTDTLAVPVPTNAASPVLAFRIWTTLGSFELKLAPENDTGCPSSVTVAVKRTWSFTRVSPCRMNGEFPTAILTTNELVSDLVVISSQLEASRTAPMSPRGQTQRFMIGSATG